MFDVGFSELLIIAVVALLVLGPERLPKAARFAGLWVRRARAQWYSVKAELERELAAEDIKRHFTEPLESLRPQMQALEQDLRDGFDGLDPQLPTHVDLRESATDDLQAWLPEAEPQVAAEDPGDAMPRDDAGVTRDDLADARIDDAPVQGDLLAPLSQRDA